MVIDFHTHMFPDKIADKTITFLAEVCQMPPQTDGTYTGLSESAKKGGVDLSIALPAMTKPSQFDSVNTFAAAHQEGNVISFGGIHPATEHYREELRHIKELGLKGIKLHPDYQNMYFNNIRYKRLVDYATELGLIIVVHAGFDPKCPDDVHCTPEMAAEVIDEVHPANLVLAHLGGNEMWDDVEKYLVGKDVYLDTAVVLDVIKEDQFLRIARNHGADKILFGTDVPWRDQGAFVHLLNDSKLTQEEKNKIFYKNACKLLDFQGNMC